jgi:hypothetical protein
MDTAKVDVVDKLFHSAFDRPREPHSAEYRAGARAALWDRINSANRSPIRQDPPYPMGTAQADAWLAGYHEGSLVWASH